MPDVHPPDNSQPEPASLQGQAALESRIAADPALLAEGWVRRFVADGHRAQEVIDLYTALGFEVRGVPVRPEEISDDCEGCRLIAMLQFQTIYTRRR